MRYEGRIFRPPSEAYSYILQATIGCSWNNCTYCDMYRDKRFRVRDLAATLDDVRMAARRHGPRVEKVFVADGDALALPMDHWRPILKALRQAFPRLRQVSCYAMATNILAKTESELAELRGLGLTLFYIGPESGDEATLRRLAKGPRLDLTEAASGGRIEPGAGARAARSAAYLYDSHVLAARRAHAAGVKTSAIFLLGAGGVERSAEHARGSARLATEMDPAYLAALTLTVVPGTPQSTLEQRGRFELPDVRGLLGELRTFVSEAKPSDALFRTNHASNYLPLGGRLPQDGPRIAQTIDRALSGAIPLRPEWSRGL